MSAKIRSASRVPTEKLSLYLIDVLFIFIYFFRSVSN